MRNRLRYAGSVVLVAVVALSLTGCGRRIVHVDREVEVYAGPPPHVHRDVHVDRDIDVHIHPRPRVHREVDIEIDRDAHLHRHHRRHRHHP